MQRAADAEVQRALGDLDKRRGASAAADPATLQAALIALDPRTGEVRALIGGRDFIQSNYNRATPGEAAARLRVQAVRLRRRARGRVHAGQRSSIASTIRSQTLQGDWVPEDGHSSASAMTMRAALKTSSNRAAVRMLEDLGIRKAVAYAERVGVGTMPSVPSLALGAGEVTLESLTAALCRVRERRRCVARRSTSGASRISDGQVLLRAPYDLRAGRSAPQTAFLMTHMLADVINHGTAWRARQLGFKLPAAGKTGTTNDYHDAWFVGYTPRLVSGVWIGFDQPQTIMARRLRSGSGGAAVGRLHAQGDRGRSRRLVQGAEGHRRRASVCRLSGKRPAEGCYSARR